jgi:hypothetical protein
VFYFVQRGCERRLSFALPTARPPARAPAPKYTLPGNNCVIVGWVKPPP